jgi:Flp pilus assembly protein TadD
MRREWFICLLLAGITLAIYWPTGHFDLVYYDDPLFVTDNAEINSGINGHSLAWAFTSIIAANWHPVTNLTFLATHQFFGVNAGVEHLVNTLFHAINAALLFLLLQRLTGATWRSAAVGALFAWHPLRVESVAWITERKDLLCGFFFLLALWAYARYAQKRSKVESRESRAQPVPAFDSRLWTLDYCLALVFFALGFMSKAMIVTLPFVLLLLDFWPLQRWSKVEGRGSRETAFPALDPRLSTLGSLFLEKWPFFALTAFFSVLTFTIQKNYAAMTSWDRLGPGPRAANAIASYLQYPADLLWPAKLAVLYPYPKNYDAGEAVLRALLLLAILALCVCQLFRRPYLAVGGFWYLGMALPIIGLVQVGEASRADRYTYLPLIGPAISLVWLLADWADANALRKRLLVPAAVMLLATGVMLTRRQVQYWANTISLFEHTAEVTRDNPAAQLGLGIGLERAGRVREATVQYRIAAAMTSTDTRPRFNLAGLLGKEGRWGEAAEQYAVIIGTNPNDLSSHLNLGDALAHLGRMDEAVFQLEWALQVAPDSPEAMNNLAWLLATCSDPKVRDGSQAVQLAERACELTHYKITIVVGTLAAAYAEAGRFDDAIATAQKAIALAEKNGEPDLLRKNQELLEIYRSHQAYHEISAQGNDHAAN